MHSNAQGEAFDSLFKPRLLGWAPLIEKYLWHEKNSIILASATLTTAGEFNYIRNTLSANEADDLALGSPFDYENSTMLFLAKDVPEPNAHGYQQAVDRALINLCKATGGRTLVLFTSYAQLRRTAQNISSPLADSGIIVYEQGEGASPNTLLDSFKTTEQAVLLGSLALFGKALMCPVHFLAFHFSNIGLQECNAHPSCYLEA